MTEPVETTVPSPHQAFGAAARTGRIVAPTIVLLCGLLVPMLAQAAEPAYPFEGTWIRADRQCTPKATLVRTYSPREVMSSRSHCSIKRVVSSGMTYELLEECRQKDRPASVTETIRMQGADAMVLKRQLVRLKIPRGIRFTRCSVAAPVAQAPHPAR